MPESGNCEKIQKLINEIKKFSNNFNDSWQYLGAKPDKKDERTASEMAEALGYMEIIKYDILELKELSTRWQFVIADAKNPYYQALKEGGITDDDANPENYEKLDVDLMRMFYDDCTAYGEAGMESWIFDLPTDLIKEKWIPPEKMKIIKEKMAQGCIPIFMPGKEFQLADLKSDHLESLRPKIVEDGTQIGASASIIGKDLDVVISTEGSFGQDLLFQSTPEKPYVLLVKPDSPEAVYSNLDEVPADRQSQTLNICEYLALQNRYTERAFDQAKEKGLELQQLTPLDKDADQLIAEKYFLTKKTGASFVVGIYIQIGHSLRRLQVSLRRKDIKDKRRIIAREVTRIELDDLQSNRIDLKK